MIYAMARDIEKRLQSRKYPVRVLYAPERATRDGAGRSTLIVVRRDREQGDAVRAVVGANRNPRKVGIRDLGVIADIYAASNVAGARVNEHEHACDALVDALLVSLYQWGEVSGAGAIPITESRYLTEAEREGEEVSPGLVYRLRFRVPRAINDVNYRGEGAPETLLTDARTVTRVMVDATHYEDI